MYVVALVIFNAFPLISHRATNGRHVERQTSAIDCWGDCPADRRCLPGTYRAQAEPHQLAAVSAIARAASRNWSSSTYSFGECAWAMLPGPKITPGMPCSAYHASSEAAVNPTDLWFAPNSLQRGGNCADDRVIRRRIDRRKEDVARLPGEPWRMLAQPGIGLAERRHVAFDLVPNLFERFVRQIPDVVFDGTVVGGRSGVRDQVEATVRAATGSAQRSCRA